MESKWPEWVTDAANELGITLPYIGEGNSWIDVIDKKQQTIADIRRKVRAEYKSARMESLSMQIRADSLHEIMKNATYNSD